MGSFYFEECRRARWKIFALANDGIVVPDKGDIAGMIVPVEYKENYPVEMALLFYCSQLLLIINFLSLYLL